jgi:hypothetical protein
VGCVGNRRVRWVGGGRGTVDHPSQGRLLLLSYIPLTLV